MKKKILIFIGIILFCLSYNTKTFAQDAPPTVTAEGAVLMDGTTGELLYEKNPDKKLAPASTTKIMTALVALENSKLDEVVTVGFNPPNIEGSAVGIISGETFTVKDLLVGLMLASGNDCAQALAEHVGGTSEAFVKLMNEKAKELGCINTNFVNPSGLYDENHYTTPRDLALILRELIKYDELLKIEKLRYYEMPPTSMDPNTKWIGNKNALVLDYANSYYPYAIAGKTGYTVDSKHSYAAAANKDGRILISTMIRGENKNYYFPETKALLEYGYNNFDLIKLYEKGEEVTDVTIYDKTIPLLASKDIYTVVKKGEDQEAARLKSCKVDMSSIGNESFPEGKELLTSSVYLKDRYVGTLALISGMSFELPISATIKDKVFQASPVLIGVIIALILLILLLFIIRTINLKRRSGRRRNPYK